jgi:hypothetical protein
MQPQTLSSRGTGRMACRVTGILRLAPGLVHSLALQLLLASAVQADDLPRPNFSKLRQDEDWSPLRDPAQRRSTLDALKFIPLNRDGSVYLSLGGELRERYEYTHNPAWGDDPQDRRGVFLQRYILHGDLHLGQHVRLFAQLLSGLESGRAGPAGPPDENRLDLQQAFIDLTVDSPMQGLATLRLGRQEMSYGSARLIDVREGPNVRRKFDGVRLSVDAAGWRVDGFTVRPAFDKVGTFDDRTDRDRALWGAYAVGKPSWLPAGAIDLYYLGFHDKAGRYVQATGRETRHTIGARLWGEHAGWDWNVELAGQAGKFNGSDIRAWTVASEIGRRWIDTPLKPRVALGANIASGDRNANDRRLGTFNPLFPRGSYFDELALLGPRNFVNLHPFVTIWPRDDVSITADWDFFWRLPSGPTASTAPPAVSCASRVAAKPSMLAVPFR